MKLGRILCLGLLLSFYNTALAFGWVGDDLQGLPCKGEAQGYGPYDYTNGMHVKEKLPIVERYHFTTGVEALRVGSGQSHYVVGDLDYTLRAFPNHHRALFAVIRYEAKQDPKKRKLVTSPECYLQRAIAFSPSDAKSRLLFGIYLHRKGKHEDAEGLYHQAIKLSPQLAEAHYNLGLLLMDEERYAEAKEHAVKAYKLGYPLPGLQRRLADAGHPLN